MWSTYSYPAACKARTYALPRPSAPPVTMAVFPDSALVSTLTSQSTFEGVYDIVLCAQAYCAREGLAMGERKHHGPDTSSIYAFQAHLLSDIINNIVEAEPVWRPLDAAVCPETRPQCGSNAHRSAIREHTYMNLPEFDLDTVSPFFQSFVTFYVAYQDSRLAVIDSNPCTESQWYVALCSL